MRVHAKRRKHRQTYRQTCKQTRHSDKNYGNQAKRKLDNLVETGETYQDSLKYCGIFVYLLKCLKDYIFAIKLHFYT